MIYIKNSKRQKLSLTILNTIDFKICSSTSFSFPNDIESYYVEEVCSDTLKFPDVISLSIGSAVIANIGYISSRYYDKNLQLEAYSYVFNFVLEEKCKKTISCGECIIDISNVIGESLKKYSELISNSHESGFPVTNLLKFIKEHLDD